MTPSLDDTKQAILKALRAMQRKQARTSVVLTLDLAAVAESIGTIRDDVQDALVDLLSEGKVEAFGDSQEHHKEDGYCRITPYGMASIRA